jgi:hypothetical protein
MLTPVDFVVHLYPELAIPPRRSGSLTGNDENSEHWHQGHS